MSIAPPITTTRFDSYVSDLNHEYERLHTAKEDAFWAAYMGLTSDPQAARADLSTKEMALQGFLQDPARLQDVRDVLTRAEVALDSPDPAVRPSEDDLVALRGWLLTFESNVIDSPEARDLANEIIHAEAALATQRGAMALGYQVPGEAFTPASSVKLGAMLAVDPDHAKRKAAWEGLRSIEPFVLSHGFIEVVKLRNRLGRMLGGEDYYDWKVRRVEGMSKTEIFALLDELEVKTREAGQRCITDLRAAKGADQVDGWNIRYLISGDISAELDPYFPFSKSLERWGRSFAALGIDYNGATLVLDLLDRKGKYENGFMHGPVPAWRDHGHFRPARIQFTANAIPGMCGVGQRATETLFHEGGHAAHFANIDMPAPCFAQEFAPSSVAMAETQSMFLDSLLSDPDWQARYARTEAGAAMPFALIEKSIRCKQPYAAWQVRSMLTVCYAEKAIYEIPDAELTPDSILNTIREVERRLLFLDGGSPRPVLSVPHLLAGESSAYYHGYVLAEMAVQQTRSFFEERDGHLTDNSRIGPDLREHYWRPGNSLRFRQFVNNLTGKPLSADALATHANRSVADTLALAKSAISRLENVASHDGPIELNATIAVRHGNFEVGSTAGHTFAEVCQKFEAWVTDQEKAAKA